MTTKRESVRATVPEPEIPVKCEYCQDTGFLNSFWTKPCWYCDIYNQSRRASDVFD